MNRAAILAVLLAAGAGGALAQDPKPDHVPPPPQTPGQLNSMAAKHPAKPEKMRPLSSAAQQEPQSEPQKAPEQTPKKKRVREAAESRPKPRDSEQKPKSR